MTLDDYGWSSYFAQQFVQQRTDPSDIPARVIAEHRGAYRVITELGEHSAVLAGRLRHANEHPAVGDWVLCRTGEGAPGRVPISAVLPRQTKISRKVPGARTTEQVVAANIDTVLLVMGLDGDYNLRRIERFLTMVWDSGAMPVVLLNKHDLLAPAEVEARVAEVQEACIGVPVHAVSCVAADGLRDLHAHLEPRQTFALLGSSGVGKSTVINRLVGEDRLATCAVRAGDDHGRHTTTSRQLLRLPQGALLVDNPGIRELQLWHDDGDGLSRTFDDLEQLARQCRFVDCEHENEPGCAVQRAVAAGELAPERLAAYAKLQREAHYFETRHEAHTRRAEGKKLAKHIRVVMRQRKRTRRP